ncbi:isoprenylcysteine carboxylmethyltransferase family protein [Roseateles sp.]|uniref:methyltransferase family protein n=1 Tax=Roseateles sp. TaxID=1971397 RepID=UPI0025EC3D6F|nr:isoprenylcysteine carboxylmethyltransferase family protein [Roseateles sp.]MBV8036194.1 isoprenylcysteine carboxylmethyltransferase family protein [Roseateles sp.]
MSLTTRPTLDAPAEGRLTEWLLRSFALLALGFMIARWGYAWLREPQRSTLLLLLVSEGYTLLLVLLARRAAQRDLSLPAVVSTIYAAGFAVLLAPDQTQALAPEWLGATLQLCGLLWQLAAKIALGRSFGLLPARRGLVLRGPYRVVRHPIYLGYLIGHFGFLLVNFSWRNAAVLALLYVAQVVRMRREEAMLCAGLPEYRAYQRRVPYRLLPFVY